MVGIRRKRRRNDDSFNLIMMALGAIIISIVLVTTIRFQRGLFGFLLAGLAVALIVFWLKDIRKTVRKEMMPTIAKQKKWFYDVIENSENITLVAEVPGPQEQVKIEVLERKIKIIGGKDFSREVNLSKKVELLNSSYINGMLNITLKKV